MSATQTGIMEDMDALQRRISSAEAIATLVAQNNDTQLGEAVRGLALMLMDIGDALDRISVAQDRHNQLIGGAS